MSLILILPLLLIVGTAFIWLGGDWLDGSSQKISDYYEVPDIVRGSVITAFGSSFPEFSSVVISTVIHGDLELGVGIVLGSAIFNVLVIPGISGVVSDGMDLNDGNVNREVGLYFVSVVLVGMLFILSNYLALGTIDVTSQTELDPRLAMVLIVAYIMYILYQWNTMRQFESEESSSTDVKLWREFGKLIASLALIGVGVEALVRAVIELGAILNTPTFFWGLIIVAASSSLPDAFVSIKQAEDDNDTTSIGNVFGSNIFDLLVVLSVGVILAGGLSITLSSVLPLLMILMVTTLIMFVTIWTGGRISTNESYMILLCYGVFVIWILLEAFGFVGLIPPASF